MTTADGLFDLSTMPTSVSILPDLPRDETADSQRYLWVIAGAGDTCSLEHCAFAMRHTGLIGDRIKHTNLTGCAPAHCGGELWFLAADTIVINGMIGPHEVVQG